MKNLTLGFVIFLLIGSCIDPITLKVDSEEGAIVVDGGITGIEGPYVVNLFRSVGVYSDLEKRPPVTGAFVYIIDDEGTRYRLKDDVVGVFVSDPSFKAEYGKSYYLRIEAFDGKVYESKPDVLRPVDDVDSVYFEFEDKVDEPNSVENNAGFNVYLDASIESDIDYVRWSWVGIHEIQTFPEKRTINAGEAGRVPDPLPCSGYQMINGIPTPIGPCLCCSCWVTQYSRTPEVGDVKFYGGKVSRYKIAYVPATSDFFLSKYYIQVQQSSISKEVYDYWKLVKVQKEGGSSLFQPTSAKIKGNLKCINDPNAEIFGLFTVSTSKTKSIIIDKNDIPYDLL
ncbi:MAG: DUF4249 domain-containing protein, partial [Cyclobacteriaceae bacterium]|nr:DUF4249 domain-containing protein [Cyclobacteriaceae bacterium]